MCIARLRTALKGCPPVLLAQVRGYNVGELAACRSFVEGAVELRLPLPVGSIACLLPCSV